MDSDKQPLIEDSTRRDTYVYGRRWWILAVFCLLGLTQASVWNTWGPIAQSAEWAFNWTDGLVALLPTIGNITFVLCVIPASILMDTKGLRVSMIICSSLLVISTSIRCFSLNSVVFPPLAYVSAALQGIASVTPVAGPPLLASVWFPVNERPIATAFGSYSSYLGLSMSFIIGPQIVPGPIYINSSLRYNGTSETPRQLDHISNGQDLESGISNFMYTHLGIALLLFVLVMIYFPTKPPRPPSVTASIERTNYKHAIQQILRNGPLWLISIAGSIQMGIFGTWISSIDIIIKDIGVSQIDAGWIGFFSTVIGCSLGVVIAKYSRYFHRRRKLFMAASITCAAICSIWFSLICDSVLAFSLSSLYIACILMGVFVNGTVPLFYEMAVEASYPVGEGVTGGFFTSISNSLGIVFLALFTIPNLGITWINWVVLGSLCISIVLLMAFPERYKRSDIDMNSQQ